MSTSGRTMRCTYELGLTVASALHVGTGRGDALVDDTVAHDACGRPIVPGTTLAGLLRAMTSRMRPESEERLWGSTEGASPVLVDDAVIDLGGKGIGTRAGIAIDRHTGAVTPGALYEHAVVPAGARLTLRLETDDRELEADLLQLLGALRADGLRVGRATTRGMGRLVADTHVAVHRIDLGDAADLVRIAQGEHGRTERVELVPEALPGVTAVTIEWSGSLPVLSRDPRPAGQVDALPLLVEAVDPDGATAGHRLALPGSSIKGALRAHAERIVRTVGGGAEDQELPFIDLLFGSAKDGGSGRRGAVHVDDCLTSGRVDPDALAALDPRAADARVPVTADDGSSAGEVLVAHHVAIDRWTGGAADRRLFDVAEARGVEWGPIRISIDEPMLHRRLPGDAEAPSGTQDAGLAAAGLLLLVIEDLAAGRVPLGGLVTRGRGSAIVHRMRWGDDALWVRSDDPDRSASDCWERADEPGGDGRIATARAAWRAAWRGAGEVRA